MSAVAASAAPLVSSRSPFDGASRPQLRSVPQPGPGPEGTPGNPLSLGRDTRARLRGAMRALLDLVGLDGASDPVRLAVLVLASRTPSETGVVEIRTRELARWLGVSASYAASYVVPALRSSALVSIETVAGEYGQDTGLRCKLLPLWAAQDVVGHPLNLAKKEYATLLRLLEAVMAPGWTLRSGRVIPPGLIGTRTGRGAATDRLALLLVVLEARETGRVRLCGGRVDTRRGRAAATVARLLGCTVSAGERILERLEAREVVLRMRLRTGSGLASRSQLMVPAVAAAHGRTGVDALREDRTKALNPVLSDPDVAARGSEPAPSDAESQVSDVPVADMADAAEPDVAAALHTDHPPVVCPVPPLSLSGGFSGDRRGGNHRLPDRAWAREDGDPLRGEQQHKSPSSGSGTPDRRPVTRRAVRTLGAAGKSGRQPGRVPLPPDDLRLVLASVDLVWARLERPAARKLVEAATRRELARVVGFAGRNDAPKVLADRLTRRLEEQMRLCGPITDPVGWLISRGLPQRRLCAEPRCDEGTLLGSGRDCPRCEDRQVDRRAQRRTVAADVATAMPHASEIEQRTATEQQLHRDVTAEAWAKARQWEQVRRQRVSATQARAEAAQLPDAALAVLPTPRPAVVVPAPGPGPAEVDVVDIDRELVLEDLTREQVLDWRSRAAADHQLVFDHIDRYGEASAQRLFTRAFAAQVQRVAHLGHLDLGFTPWGPPA